MGRLGCRGTCSWHSRGGCHRGSLAEEGFDVGSHQIVDYQQRDYQRKNTAIVAENQLNYGENYSDNTYYDSQGPGPPFSTEEPNSDGEVEYSENQEYCAEGNYERGYCSNAQRAQSGIAGIIDGIRNVNGCC